VHDRPHTYLLTLLLCSDASVYLAVYLVSAANCVRPQLAVVKDSGIWATGDTTQPLRILSMALSLSLQRAVVARRAPQLTERCAAGHARFIACSSGDRMNGGRPGRHDRQQQVRSRFFYATCVSERARGRSLRT
jgi:hypothetical protein